MEVLKKFEEAAKDPRAILDRYLREGKDVVLVAPVYTPEEIVHSFGMVPMGAWGADTQLNGSKKYFPAFICSIVQSIVELGMNGAYDGVKALIVPSLCDSLKVLGENWKYAVPDIPFIPMTYPQNRKPEYALEYTKAGYRRVISDLEKISGKGFDENALKVSIEVYNEHNRLMRETAEELRRHPEITAEERSAIYKSATFLRKEEHSALLKELLQELQAATPGREKIRIVTTGILADSPSLLQILDENGLQIVADDIAAESRQYKTDCVLEGDALTSLARKFSARDNCSVLYDVKKSRVEAIVDLAKKTDAGGVLMILTKFCDPEEFDYPLIRKACEKAGLPIVEIEVDRQMENYEQASTIIESFREMMEL
ncbi:MAG: 2-hydroxyacyl-CoA dehydratase [Erysipelotrichaceae bacterium]|nr:2-hydroxyacyl-CoA dehydratase [Erysipelotrichaceae bacterium]